MSKVCQLFSGSSGNSIFISACGHNYLVDIGVSAKRCEQALLDIGVEPSSIEAVFVTHEHCDHSKGVRVFANRYAVPVYASEKCALEMRRTGITDDKTKLMTIDRHLSVDGAEALAFHQSHDSVDCIGYRFNFSDGRSASVCTDTGFVTDEAKAVLPETDLIFIESNHEISMLKTGSYPYPLKQRILGAYGHLSNTACGEYIKELAKSGTTRFVLSHLSKENNVPQLARQTAVAAFDEIGFKEGSDYRLYVSREEHNGGGIVL